ncbi:MAG: mannonate dehydratase [Spirochaetaceae bacterium]|jgi:mannonate dehydratase|nr:mannonate dehydratase [Spirochaetaceae bacterium]
MKIIFRWFGSNDDSVTLEQIRQIPGKPGIAGTLGDIPAGEAWPANRIDALKKQVEDAGLKLEVIESVNIHDSIKTGAPERDKCIENYITTIERLGSRGVKVICYNFMPVFDWTRSDLYKKLEDGSTALSYEQKEIDKINPENIAQTISKGSKGYSLPGWEPERMSRIKELFAAYTEVTEEKLRDNLKYFLDAIIPSCEKYDVKMAIHPDDPPWGIFGLPRIVRNESDITKLLSMCSSPYNGLTLCTGCLGASTANDIPAMIRKFADRIHFTHVRNIKIHSEGDFNETSHLSADGSLDLYEIMKAYYDVGYTGYLRPDHGRMIWNEQARPGYGLYDRALGIAYINGLWEAINKGNRA